MRSTLLPLAIPFTVIGIKVKGHSPNIAAHLRPHYPFPVSTSHRRLSTKSVKYHAPSSYIQGGLFSLLFVFCFLSLLVESNICGLDLKSLVITGTCAPTQECVMNTTVPFSGVVSFVSIVA